MAELDKFYHNNPDMGLAEACARLAADISDQELNLIVLTSWGTYVVQPWLVGWHASRPWLRREIAIGLLDAAVSSGQLRVWLLPENEAPRILTNLQWYANPERRNIILGGEWRDSAGGLTQWNGAQILVDERAFSAWRRASAPIDDAETRPETTIKANATTPETELVTLESAVSELANQSFKRSLTNAYDRRSEEFRKMRIGAVSKALATETGQSPRYIEKLLLKLGLHPRTRPPPT